MAHPPSLSDVETALRRVLEATEAAEAALDPLDVDAFERAVAERGQAMDGLGTASPALPTDALRDLASRAAEADRRVRERAVRALAAVREELRAVVAGRNGLGGYRPSVPNLPRFADRRG